MRLLQQVYLHPRPSRDHFKLYVTVRAMASPLSDQELKIPSSELLEVFGPKDETSPLSLTDRLEQLIDEQESAETSPLSDQELKIPSSELLEVFGPKDETSPLSDQEPPVWPDSLTHRLSSLIEAHAAGKLPDRSTSPLSDQEPEDEPRSLMDRLEQIMEREPLDHHESLADPLFDQEPVGLFDSPPYDREGVMKEPIFEEGRLYNHPRIVVDSPSPVIGSRDLNTKDGANNAEIKPSTVEETGGYFFGSRVLIGAGVIVLGYIIQFYA